MRTNPEKLSNHQNLYLLPRCLYMNMTTICDILGRLSPSTIREGNVDIV